MNPEDISPGHNPAKLTNAQVGDGWRLLDQDEVFYYMGPAPISCECWGEQGCEWQSGYCGAAREYTYRTRLGRAELRAARGMPPEAENKTLEALSEWLNSPLPEADPALPADLERGASEWTASEWQEEWEHVRGLMLAVEEERDRLAAELAETRADLAASKRSLRMACLDWADDDTGIKAIGKRVGMDVEGNSFYVPGIVDVGEFLAKELDAAKIRIGQLTSAILSPKTDEIACSCDCRTKTPAIEHHESGCRYRLIMERDEARKQLAELEADIDNVFCGRRVNGMSQPEYMRSMLTQFGAANKRVAELDQLVGSLESSIKRCGVVLPTGLNDKTANLVVRFATAVATKLLIAQEKYSRQDEWSNADWEDELLEDTERHFEKGDPRDVAAYCAFAWNHGWKLSLPEKQKIANELSEARKRIAELSTESITMVAMAKNQERHCREWSDELLKTQHERDALKAENEQLRKDKTQIALERDVLIRPIDRELEQCRRERDDAVKPGLHKFGRLMYDLISGKDWWFGDEWSEEVMPLALQAGLAIRTKYDPEEHGIGIEAEEGDEIWLWTGCGSDDTEQQQAARIAELEQKLHAKFAEDDALGLRNDRLAQQAEAHTAEIERLNAEIRELTNANQGLAEERGDNIANRHGLMNDVKALREKLATTEATAKDLAAGLEAQHDNQEEMERNAPTLIDCNGEYENSALRYKSVKALETFRALKL